MAKIKRVHSLGRGQRLEVEIESLAAGGEGVAHHDGIAIFVGRVAQGDKVEVELFDVRKSFARAKVVKLLTPSKTRVQAFCKYFDRCGGCQWQHIAYSAQLDAKKEIVRNAIVRVGQLTGVSVGEPLAAPSPSRYRNKVQYPVQEGRKPGSIEAGYFEENSHTLVDLDECPVQPDKLDTVLQVVKRELVLHNFLAYDERSQDGLIRHICARQSFFNGDILVTLVIYAEGLKSISEETREAFESLAEQLMEQVPEVKGVCLNFNAESGNKILGDTTIVLAGDSEIEEVLQSKRENRPQQLKDGVKFRLSTSSFFQINSEQAANLFDEVYDAVEAIKQKKGNEPLEIIDAYAGVGAIAMWLAPLAQSVLAIEEHEQAVKDGVKTVALNNVKIIDFDEGKVEDVLSKLADEKTFCDVLVIDPPRKGVSPQVIECLLKLAPEHIVYVSCNPQTLARDLRLLQDGILLSSEDKETVIGYKTEHVKPVDLFPQTHHIESVTVLEKFVKDGSVGDLA